jgi:pyrimidine operon attenuation protein/uracil phosphoribosyltransferase
MSTQPDKVLDAAGMRQALERLVDEITSRHGDCVDVGFIGVQRRGAELAERLKELLDTRTGRRIPLGKLDINLYRDDWTDLQVQPEISCTEIPFDITGRSIILVDDVLFTGRTTRAALEAILDFGRPERVELLVLVDRGNRELPIQPDYLGLALATSPEDHVDVLVAERDDVDQVRLNTASGKDS